MEKHFSDSLQGNRSRNYMKLSYRDFVPAIIYMYQQTPPRQTNWRGQCSNYLTKISILTAFIFSIEDFSRGKIEGDLALPFFDPLLANAFFEITTSLTVKAFSLKLCGLMALCCNPLTSATGVTVDLLAIKKKNRKPCTETQYVPGKPQQLHELDYTNNLGHNMPRKSPLPPPKKQVVRIRELS